MNMGRSWCVTMALVLSALGASVHADVAPGDKIDATNVVKAKDLISPGLEWCIKRGFPITVGESKRVEWPKAYKEATAIYLAERPTIPIFHQVWVFAGSAKLQGFTPYVDDIVRPVGLSLAK